MDELAKRGAITFANLSDGDVERAIGMLADCYDDEFRQSAKRHLVEAEGLSEEDAEGTVDGFLAATRGELERMAGVSYENDGHTADGYDPDGNYDPDHDEVERLERLSSYIG